MSNKQEQLCGVDSNTGHISYYFNPSTGEVKWVNQPLKGMSKQIRDQLPSQMSSGFDTEELRQSEKLDNLEDNGTPRPDQREHVQIQTASTDECSNLISEELVTVVLESCSDSGEKAESSSSVMESNREMTKATWEQEPTDTGNSFGVIGDRRENIEQLLSEKNSDTKSIRSTGTQIDTMVMVSRRHRETEGTGQELPSGNKTARITSDNNDVKDNNDCDKRQEMQHSNNTGSGTDGEIIQNPQSENLQFKKCGKCLKKCSVVAVHHGQHCDEKPFICEECKKCFRECRGPTYLVRIPSEEKPYKCQQCGKCFRHSSTLGNHVRIHSGEKLFRCKECQMCFLQSGTLTRHVRTHSGVKPYKCKQCAKCFRHSDSLTKHFRTHSGEKPYTCKQCEKCFTTSSNLSYHVQTHSEEKQFKCEQCEKGFRKRSHLTDHMRTHSGEKPYKCKQCQKFFSTSSSLASHVRKHSKEKTI